MTTCLTTSSCIISLYCHSLNWFQHNLIIKLSINFHHSKYLCLQDGGWVHKLRCPFLYLKQRHLFFLLKYTIVSTFFSVLETKKYNELAGIQQAEVSAKGVRNEVWEYGLDLSWCGRGPEAGLFMHVNQQ